MPTASSRAERSPDQREAVILLELADKVFDGFRPEVVQATTAIQGNPRSRTTGSDKLHRQQRVPAIADPLKCMSSRGLVLARPVLRFIYFDKNRKPGLTPQSTGDV